MQASIQLIVGLGNPGPEYDKTRHNAGAWFVEQLADQYRATFNTEKKFQSLHCRTDIESKPCHLLLPTTFMNHSGQAVKAIATYYKIPANAILVAHDELDLAPGDVKLKRGGGHGGHNGLRDIINHLGNKDFARLRIGIGHPGHKDRVLDYVLGRPSRSDADKIQDAISNSLCHITDITSGNIDKAMQNLHTKT